MHPCSIALVVKRAVASIGLEPAPYAGHSLRAGFVTAAVVQGVNEIAIMEHTGHRSLSTLRRYYRRGDPFQANACAMVGL
jgi:integrase